MLKQTTDFQVTFLQFYYIFISSPESEEAARRSGDSRAVLWNSK